MTSYIVTPGSDQVTFQVATVGSDGVRRTLLGFSSYADAQAWIKQDQRQRTDNNPWMASHFQMPWRF